MDRVLSLLSSLAGSSAAGHSDASSAKEARQIPPASPVVVGVRVQHVHSEGLLSPKVWTNFLDRLRTDAASDLRRRMAANIRRLADFADHVLAEGDAIARPAPTFSGDGGSILELSGVEEQVSTAFRRLVQHTVDQLAAHPLWADDLAAVARAAAAPIVGTSLASALDAVAAIPAADTKPGGSASAGADAAAPAPGGDGADTAEGATTASVRGSAEDSSCTAASLAGGSAPASSAPGAPSQAAASSSASTGIGSSSSDEADVRWTREALCECVEKLLASRGHAAMWACFARAGRPQAPAAADAEGSAAPQAVPAAPCALASRFQRRCELIHRLLGPEHLGLPHCLFDACYEGTWALLRAELRRLAAFHTPRDKLVALWNASRLLLGLLSASRERDAFAAALAKVDDAAAAAERKLSAADAGAGAPRTPPPERADADGKAAEVTPNRLALGVGPGDTPDSASDACAAAAALAESDDAEGTAGAAPHASVAGPTLTPATADDLLPAAVLTIARFWPDACAAAKAAVSSTSESAADGGSDDAAAAAPSAGAGAELPRTHGSDFPSHLRFIRAMRGSEALRSEAGYHLTAFESAVTLIMSDEDVDDDGADGGLKADGDAVSAGSGGTAEAADGLASAAAVASRSSRAVPILLASKPNPAICAVDEHTRLLAAWQALEAELEAADGVVAASPAPSSGAAAASSLDAVSQTAVASVASPRKSAAARRGERLLACLLPPPCLDGIDVSTPEGVDAAFKRWYDERAAFLSRSAAGDGASRQAPAAGDGPVTTDITGASVAQAAALLTDYQHLLATVQRLREVALAEE